MPEKNTLKTFDVGDLWSKISGSIEALLCSSVYRLYYEAIQYSIIEIWGRWVGQNNKIKIKSTFFNIDYSEWP